MPLDFARIILRAARDQAYEPADAATINQAESQLGFELPPLVKRLYSEAGDGGFGPGYGFYGLIEGTDEFPDETVVRLYLSFRRPDPEDALFVWPKGLLPLLDWGCATRSCVDCKKPSLPVMRFDPNLEPEAQINSEKLDFEEWLQAWLEGKELW